MNEQEKKKESSTAMKLRIKMEGGDKNVTPENFAVDPAVAKAMIINKEAKLASDLCQIPITIMLYPYEYVRVLMQVGYEPFEPVHSLTMFRRPCLKLPSVFEYVNYVKNVDGIFGCYRGLVPYLLFRGTHSVFCKVGTKFLEERIALPGDPNFQFGSREVATRQNVHHGKLKTYLRDLGLAMVCRGIVLVVTYPLRLIAIHAMAEIIEREPALKRGIFGLVKEIWNTQGISGFFNGLTPRLLGDGIAALSIGLSTYVIRDHLANTGLGWCLRFSMTVLTSTIVYPFNVVSTMMALNGGCLSLGLPPYTPVFVSWKDCWKYLKNIGQLRRGSNVFFRYYTGPTISISGIMRPSIVFFGPNLSQDIYKSC